MYKSLLIITTLLTTPLHPMQTDQPEESIHIKDIQTSNAFKDATLHYHNGQFLIKHNQKTSVVLPELIDKELLKLSEDDIRTLFKPFMVLTEEQAQDLQLEFVREATKEEIKELMSQHTSYIKITQTDDGQWVLHLKHRMLGGGYFGAMAGAWVGKFVASAVCHGGIMIVGGVVSVFATPVAGALVIASLETTFAAPIEAITTTAALAAGIAGGVATGMV